MGKTKNQLRREVLMMRLRQLKRHIPAIAGAVGTIAATAIAVHYKNELEKFEADHFGDGWSTIPVPPSTMEDLEAGGTMLYRHVRISDEDVYAQYNTGSNEFSDEANERFEEAKKERDNA
ncbi:hypothetical protein [Streptomyces phage Psst4]|nr:hypothetical protein [Streptomyces phage Psst4]